MRLPRLFPPKPFRPVLVAGHAWCQFCDMWKPFDVIPANTQLRHSSVRGVYPLRHHTHLRTGRASVVKIRCRIGWHAWNPWRKGAKYVDISYGDRVPSRKYDRECRDCGKPQNTFSYGGS